MGVSWNDAEAYCEWKRRETGIAWRLPTEHEREKAARGVDGRVFPWGSFEDACLAKCRESRELATQPEPVGAFPTATSVYGVVDATGGMWEWTGSWFDHRRASRVVRGGSWNNPTQYLRCAMRSSFRPASRFAVCGFRCAHGFDSGGPTGGLAFASATRIGPGRATHTS